jgi:hypothetical protein
LSLKTSSSFELEFEFLNRNIVHVLKKRAEFQNFEFIQTRVRVPKAGGWGGGQGKILQKTDGTLTELSTTETADTL